MSTSTTYITLDNLQEEELRQEGDPKKYGHLREDLHVEITAFAAAPEAYTRIGHALQEVKRFLVPVSVSFKTKIFSNFLSIQVKVLCFMKCMHKTFVLKDF